MRQFFMAFTLAAAMTFSGCNGGDDDDTGATGDDTGACGVAEGAVCDEDATCPCQGDMECKREDGPAGTGDLICWDFGGDAADGTDCTWADECTNGYCYAATAGADATCQASCVASGQPAPPDVGNCCSQGSSGGNCN